MFGRPDQPAHPEARTTTVNWSKIVPSASRGLAPRSRAAVTDRIVSPRRVIYYRGNWYVDAWCHEKEMPRRFAIDAIREATVLDEPARDVAAGDNQGYGIFAGPPEHIAILVFDPEPARWSEEEWRTSGRPRTSRAGSRTLAVRCTLTGNAK